MTRSETVVIPTRPEVFPLGCRVQVRLNSRNATRRFGVVTRIIWHVKDSAWDYYLAVDGRKISKRYREEDLEMAEAGSEHQSGYDEERIDQAVLALLYLTSFSDHEVMRAWKSHDWEALNRLHAKGLIGDPATKAKSVVFTDDGFARARAAFDSLFGRGEA